MSDIGRQTSEHSVELRIEELVLHGFAPGERYVIGDAVERELIRLLATQLPVQPEPSTQDCLGGEDIHLQSGVGAREVGVKIGRSVFASLTTYWVGKPNSPQKFARVSQYNVHDNRSAQINKKGN